MTVHDACRLSPVCSHDAVTTRVPGTQAASREGLGTRAQTPHPASRAEVLGKCLNRTWLSFPTCNVGASEDLPPGLT